MPTAPPSARVLILTPQPLLAALLGMLMELEQFEPMYAAPDESPEDALARIKPLLVVVLDADLAAAHSDLFFARAAKRGIRVVLFAPPGGGRDVRALAEARSLAWFSLPIDRPSLARLLGDGTSRTRGGSDRRHAAVSVRSDGSIVYDDDSGHRWFVYDRRGRDRRGGGEATGGDSDFRVFVSETGEEWHVPLLSGEPLELTVTALAEQLKRAAPVRHNR